MAGHEGILNEHERTFEHHYAVSRQKIGKEEFEHRQDCGPENLYDFQLFINDHKSRLSLPYLSRNAPAPTWKGILRIPYPSLPCPQLETLLETHYGSAARTRFKNQRIDPFDNPTFGYHVLLNILVPNHTPDQSADHYKRAVSGSDAFELYDHPKFLPVTKTSKPFYIGAAIAFAALAFYDPGVATLSGGILATIGTFLEIDKYALKKDKFIDSLEANHSERTTLLTRLNTLVEQEFHRATTLRQKVPSFETKTQLEDIYRRIEYLYETAGKVYSTIAHKPGIILAFRSDSREAILKQLEPILSPQKIETVQEQPRLEKIVLHALDLPHDEAAQTYLRAQLLGFTPTELDLKNACTTGEKADIILNEIKKKYVTTSDTLRVTTTERSTDLADYVLGEELGSGGMGRVYRAKDKQSRIVAVKVPLADENIPQFTKLQRIADTIKNLNHENIAKVYVINTDEKKPFIVAELIEGGNLLKYIKSLPSVETRVKMFRGIVNGIAHAHTQGVLHRDIKPSNILLTRDGIPKVADFDLATIDPEAIALSIEVQKRPLDNRNDASLQRSMNNIVGTLDYLSPEEREGKPATSKSDVYRLGLVGFETMSGLHPNVTRKTLRKLEKNIPKGVETIIEQCLETDPKERPEARVIAKILEAHQDIAHKTIEREEELLED